MNAVPFRDPMRDSAYEWAAASIAGFYEVCNRSLADSSAAAEYHGMVDGIVWTDEMPLEAKWDRETFQKIFCVLVHTRTSLILGEKISAKGIELLQMVRSGSPQWCFNLQDRNSTDRKEDYLIVRRNFFGKIDQLDQRPSRAKNHPQP